MQLILDERKEQQEKHGFSLEHDAKHYENGELLDMAKYAMELSGRHKKGVIYPAMRTHYPIGWDAKHNDTLKAKTQKGQLIVAGAMYLAEDEKNGNHDSIEIIGEISKQIDDLQSDAHYADFIDECKNECMTGTYELSDARFEELCHEYSIDESTAMELMASTTVGTFQRISAMNSWILLE